VTKPVSDSALYLDTSCLLKLFFPEPESARVAAVLATEERVLVSELGRLEAETQLRARRVGGLVSKAKYQRLADELAKTLTLAPFEVLPFPEDGFDRARLLAARTQVHCRTLDLLHVAAMEAAGVERLFTNDGTQASVAKALGFEVRKPSAG
jgi:predicted nucleic acid-binding protein